MASPEQQQHAEALHLVGAHEALKPEDIADNETVLKAGVDAANKIDVALKRGEKPKEIHEVLAQGDFSSFDRQERIDRSLDVFGTDISPDGKKVLVREEQDRHTRALFYEHAVNNLLQHGSEWFDDDSNTVYAQEKNERKNQKAFLITGIESALKKVPGLESLEDTKRAKIAEYLLTQNGMKQEYAKLLDGALDPERLSGIFSREEIDRAEEERKRIAAEAKKIELALEEKGRHQKDNERLTDNLTNRKKGLSTDITSMQELLDTSLDKNLQPTEDGGSLYRQLARVRGDYKNGLKDLRETPQTVPSDGEKMVENPDFKTKSAHVHKQEEAVNQLRQDIENTERQLREKRAEIDRINEDENRLKSSLHTLELELSQGKIDETTLTELLTSKAALLESAKLAYHSKEKSFVSELQAMAEKGAIQYFIDQDIASSDARKEYFKKEEERTQNEGLKKTLENMDELWFRTMISGTRSSINPGRRAARSIGQLVNRLPFNKKIEMTPEVYRPVYVKEFQPQEFNRDMQVLLRGDSDSIDKLLGKAVRKGNAKFTDEEVSAILKNPAAKSQLTARLVESMLQAEKDQRSKTLALSSVEREKLGKLYGATIIEQAVKDDRIDKDALSVYMENDAVKSMTPEEIRQELENKPQGALAMLLSAFMEGLLLSQKEIVYQIIQPEQS